MANTTVSNTTMTNATMAADNSTLAINGTEAANVTWVNLAAFNNSTDCNAMQNPIIKFGFSYSFKMGECYLIAGPRTPPSTIPTYAEAANGAPPGAFFKYTPSNNTDEVILNVCVRPDCKTCNAPQMAPLDQCIDNEIGWYKFAVKTYLSDIPDFGEAPLSTVNWTAFPPLKPGQSPNTDLWTTATTTWQSHLSTSRSAPSATAETQETTTHSAAATGTRTNKTTDRKGEGAQGRNLEVSTGMSSSALANAPSLLMALAAGALAMVF